MPRLTLSIVGLDAVRTHLLAMQARLPEALLAAAQQIANDARDQLAAAAPQGQNSGDAPPIEGDAPGPLRDSFQVETLGDATQFTVAVVCTQPSKLRYVREGRGEVLPLRPKFGLMWQALDHPVARAGPSQANDFVTPVLQTAMDSAGAALAEAVTAVVDTP